MLPEELRSELTVRTGLALPSNTVLQAKGRGTHTDALAPMWEEMTEVRRSAPAGAQW
jgi:1,2-phenylacetyl-CoA epoxidase catalytic subunit